MLRRFALHSDAELRILSEVDAEAIFRLIQENQTYLQKRFQWAYQVHTIEDSLHFVHESTQKLKQSRAFDAGIWYQGQLAGMVGLHPIDWLNREVEIGYWLGEKYQGLGLVTKAVRLMLSYAFEQLKLNRVELLCAVDNERSKAVACRLNFVFEGTEREGLRIQGKFFDVACYSLLAKEYFSNVALQTWMMAKKMQGKRISKYAQSSR